MRASILALGPLLARCGEARVSLPGGCAIGLRPVDQHVKGLQAMGAEIDLEHGYINARATRLTGARIRVRRRHRHRHREPDDGGHARRRHRPMLENAAREPEVVDLARCLVAMGARITGAGTDRIVDRRRRRAARRDARDHARPHRDRHVPRGGGRGGRRRRRSSARAPDTLDGGDRQAARGRRRHRRRRRRRSACARKGALRAVNVRTAPYPGFPTDMQAQFMALATRADGTSVITETIFENRMMHVQELVRLGADIEVEGNTAIVKGVAEADRRQRDGHRSARVRVPRHRRPDGRGRDDDRSHLPSRSRLRAHRGEALARSARASSACDSDAEALAMTAPRARSPLGHATGLRRTRYDPRRSSVPGRARAAARATLGARPARCRSPAPTSGPRTS